MPSSRFEPVGSTLTLPLARTLGYHTSGDPNGVPVIYIHGNPDSGIQVTGELETRMAKKLGIRWIGPDRPGVGLSTMYDGQAVSHYPQDIQCLVNHLSLKEYYIIGTSGGAGYALACAKDLSPTQLKGVGICARIGPIECGFDSMDETIRNAWNLWMDYPSDMKAYFDTEYSPLAQMTDATMLRDRLKSDFKSWFAAKDLDHMLQDGMLESAVQGFRQIYAQGATAHAKGIEVNMQPWGFNIEDIKFKGVRLWYGEEDVTTTPTMGKFMADRLPESVYKEYEKATHITIWNEENLEDMLRDLLSITGR
ncbi:hypothetical protein N0V90_005120 [Kalmusia sp. IMI 367209]|nr:hypothetical protein N0V90_005120 [Kalmusia sp. IMI 367209]